jgi:hypothetical protein
MATSDKRDAITSIADQIRKSQAAQRDRAVSSDTEQISKLIDSLKKQREENTVMRKFNDKMMEKVDKTFRSTTLMRVAIPKFFKTFHENLDTYDKQLDAQRKLEKITVANREAELKELKSGIDALINGSKGLRDIKDRFGESAAVHAALVEEEMKMFKDAEAAYLKKMDDIENRKSNLGQDAMTEWFKNAGIVRVKVVEDEPSKDELDKIKNALAEQIEKDADRADQERIEAKKKATDERRYKEETLKNAKKGIIINLGDGAKRAGNGFLTSLLNMFGGLFSGDTLKTLLKTIVGAGLLAAVHKYFTDPEFKAAVDKVIDDITDEYITPMWEGFKKDFKKKWEDIWPDLKSWMYNFTKTYWKEMLALYALTHPLKTIGMIFSALSLLGSLLLGKGGIVAAFRLLGAALLGKAGLIALVVAALGYLGYKLNKWLTENAEMGKEGAASRAWIDKWGDKRAPVEGPSRRTMKNEDAYDPLADKFDWNDLKVRQEIDRRVYEKSFRGDIPKFGGSMAKDAKGNYTSEYLDWLAKSRGIVEEEMLKQINDARAKFKKPLIGSRGLSLESYLKAAKEGKPLPGADGLPKADTSFVDKQLEELNKWWENEQKKMDDKIKQMLEIDEYRKDKVSTNINSVGSNNSTQVVNYIPPADARDPMSRLQVFSNYA